MPIDRKKSVKPGAAKSTRKRTSTASASKATRKAAKKPARATARGERVAPSVLLCHWKRTKSGFRLWVADAPKVAATGDDLAEAQEELEAALIDAGYIETTLEFDPPLPDEEDAAPAAATLAKSQPPAVECDWHQRPDGDYELWVVGRRRVSERGASFELCQLLLSTRIGEELGIDGSRQTFRTPPPPPWPPRVDWEAIRVPGVHPPVKVVGSSNAEFTNGDELFAGGLCTACRHGIGPRTDVPLMLGKGARGDALTAKPGDAAFNGDRIRLFSEAFLDALTDAERRALVTRPATSPPRARATYHELLGVRHAVPRAPLEGVAPLEPVCATCGRAPRLAYHVLTTAGKDMPMEYVRGRDLPGASVTVFALRGETVPELCFTSERWRQLVGTWGRRGLKSYPLGVLR